MHLCKGEILWLEGIGVVFSEVCFSWGSGWWCLEEDSSCSVLCSHRPNSVCCWVLARGLNRHRVLAQGCSHWRQWESHPGSSWTVMNALKNPPPKTNPSTAQGSGELWGHQPGSPFWGWFRGTHVAPGSASCDGVSPEQIGTCWFSWSLALLELVQSWTLKPVLKGESGTEGHGSWTWWQWAGSWTRWSQWSFLTLTVLWKLSELTRSFYSIFSI